jgi:hypothetical protein
LGLPHHDAEILRLAAGVCELIVESGKADRHRDSAAWQDTLNESSEVYARTDSTDARGD